MKGKEMKTALNPSDNFLQPFKAFRMYIICVMFTDRCVFLSRLVMGSLCFRFFFKSSANLSTLCVFVSRLHVFPVVFSHLL